ncbi:MAG: type IV secretion system DNA-binding domain-containing protein [Bacteriovoracaceae bacterium]|jgi:GTPase SAR1 family protein|nr:type IV secretion system DNA-binding domain-containing protein [Bacteriovoracaceae bacterium]
MSNKNKKSNNDLDLFTPIYEIFHELCVLLAECVKEIFVWIFKKIMNKAPELQKIDRKSAKVTKTTHLEDALGIDTKTKKEVVLNDIDFRRHSFIVGASGFGKTNLMSILQEHSLRKDKPMIFFDPKGDTKALNTFKDICAKYNRPCYIFSEHYPQSISLNPVLEGSINQVVDRIMSAFEWSEPFYKDASRRSLLQVLKILKSKDEPFTLKAIFDELERIQSKDNLGLITKIEAILESDFGKILNADNDGLTLSKIREENACLYIGLSTQGYPETAMAVGKLFLGELLYNSYKSLSDNEDPEAGLKKPISVFFDEFGAIVTPEFIELQNKCRGAGMELTIAVQSTSDIDKIDTTLTEQIVENAGNIFVLKQRLAKSAGFFAESIGTILTKKQTHKIENGQQMEAGSEREVHELIVHSDIIKNLRIGQCILLRQGPTRVNLINVRNRDMDKFRKVNRMRRQNPELFAHLGV